jgi:hypothetical protein
MAKKSKFKSDMSEAIHSSAAALHKTGAIDNATMLDFDARHLVPSEIAPGQPLPAPSLKRMLSDMAESGVWDVEGDGEPIEPRQIP